MASIENSNAAYNARPQILVVDDDLRIADLLTRFLLDKGICVLSANNAEEASEIILLMEFDLIILDVMMPGKNGVDFAQDLRRTSDTPIIFLTALGELDDRIKGLAVGADDYIVKPFDPNELLLRIHAVLRRTMRPMQDDLVLVIAGNRLNVASGHLVNDTGAAINLTDAERELLLVLARHNGEPLSRNFLAEHTNVANSRAIDVQITRLRKKIEDSDSDVRCLQTVRGQGYILRGQVEQSIK